MDFPPSWKKDIRCFSLTISTTVWTMRTTSLSQAAAESVSKAGIKEDACPLFLFPIFSSLPATARHSFSFFFWKQKRKKKDHPSSLSFFLCKGKRLCLFLTEISPKQRQGNAIHLLFSFLKKEKEYIFLLLQKRKHHRIPSEKRRKKARATSVIFYGWFSIFVMIQSICHEQWYPSISRLLHQTGFFFALFCFSSLPLPFGRFFV